MVPYARAVTITCVIEMTRRVGQVLSSEGISDDELMLMLDKGWTTTLRGFNWCYSDWLLKIQGAAILDMQRAKMKEFGTGETCIIEKHEACQGKGCRACGWIGRIRRWMTDKALPTPAPSGGGRRRSRVKSSNKGGLL